MNPWIAEETLTKSSNLSPVPAPPVAVERRVSSAGAHFPRCDSGWVCVSPSALDVFSVGPPDAWAIIEGILCVATGSVGREVEFRDEVLQGKSLLGNVELGGVLRDPSKQVYGPTASDVVRYLDYFDLFLFYCREEDVIHVDEPNQISVL
jgi:hypothetical protein